MKRWKNGKTEKELKKKLKNPETAITVKSSSKSGKSNFC